MTMEIGECAAIYRPDEDVWEFWVARGMVAIAPLTEREAKIVLRRIARRSAFWEGAEISTPSLAY
jgi:hypothetical protein